MSQCVGGSCGLVGTQQGFERNGLLCHSVLGARLGSQELIWGSSGTDCYVTVCWLFAWARRNLKGIQARRIAR